MLFEFSIEHICTCLLGQGHFYLDGANLRIQTHFLPEILHQNIVEILRHLYYVKKGIVQ